MIKVVVIGGGNIAIHLVKAFLKLTTVQLVQVYARNINQIKHFSNEVSLTDKLEKLQDADLYILALSDKVISSISSKMPASKLVVHTSGSVSIKSLKNKGRRGVFYMLQSFSKHKKVNFNDIPFCIEAENEDDFSLLKKLALALGNKVYNINSEQRRYLHIAAVFVNNFTNHLYYIGNEICNQHKIPFKILYPLILETATKIQELTPVQAQTGPAKRRDTETIKNHLNLLNTQKHKIYKVLTDSIINGEKLQRNTTAN
ncbi:MAG: Rossmann-like and DUF2520 domain-containing protein [Tenacibaculum sp.]